MSAAHLFSLASRSKAGGRAGVPWVSFHTFRHTAATMLFRSGLNAKQVQVWLGHYSPAFTLGTYVHLLSDDLPDADFLDATTASEDNGERDLASMETAIGAAVG
jgi:integrase